MTEEITVQRNPLGFRIIHWIHMIAIVLLALTGWQIYGSIWGIQPIFGSYHVARAWHMGIGIFTAFWWFIVMMYYCTVTGNMKEHFLTFADFSYVWNSVKNFFGIGKHPTFSRYNPRTGKWYLKYNFGQKFFFWLNTLALIVIGLTGLAGWDPVTFRWVCDILAVFGPAEVVRRGVHYILFWYFALIGLASHAYFGVVLPTSWQTARSMITGRGRFKRTK